MTAEVEARHAKELAELEQQESSTAAATAAVEAMSVAPEQQQEVKEAKVRADWLAGWLDSLVQAGCGTAVAAAGTHVV
jgi:hypothetical protein